MREYDQGEAQAYFLLSACGRVTDEHYQAHYRPESVDAMVETFLGVLRCVADAPEVTLDALRRALRPSWSGFLEPDKAGTVLPR